LEKPFRGGIEYPRRMSTYYKVPYLSRGMYLADLRASLFRGVMLGIMPLAGFVALKTLKATPWEVALIEAASALAMFFTIYSARLCHDKPKMPFIIYPELIGRGLLILVVFITTAAAFTALIVIIYIIVTIMIPPYNAWMRHNYPDRLRGQIVGSIRSKQYLVCLVAAFLAGWLLKQNEQLYRLIFPLTGVFGIAAALTFRRTRLRGERQMLRSISTRPDSVGTTENASPELNNGPASVFARIGSIPLQPILYAFVDGAVAPYRTISNVLRRDRAFASFMGAFSLMGFGNIMMQPVLRVFLNNINLNYTQATFVLAVFPNVMLVLFSRFWGKYVDRYNPMLLRMVVALLWSIYPLTLFLTKNIWLIYAACAVSGFAVAGSTLVWTLGTMYFARQEDVTLYMGIHTTLVGVRGLTAPFVGVWLMGIIGVQPVFLISFILMVISGVLMGDIGLKEHRRL
jgi:MFS family permease